MTVTIPADPSTTLGQLRLEVADDTAGQGPLPDGSNIPDETLLAFWEGEGQDIGRAAARTFEYLARKWAAMPNQTRLDREWERFEAMQNFRAEAKRLRNLHGYSSGTRTNHQRGGAARTEVTL